MATGNVYRGAVRGHFGTVEWVNTLFFKQTGSSSDLGTLADAIDTTIYQAIEAFFNPAWKLDDITLSELVVGGGEQLVSPRTTAGTGSVATNATTDSAVMSFRTALAGRSHRGRNYVALSSSGTGANGVITGSIVTALLNAYNAFKAIYGPGGTGVGEYEWGVWSRKLGETISGGHVTGYNPSAGFFPITTVKCDGIFRVQRRREVGVGV